MKKIIILLMTVCFAVSCQYDDSEIWDKLNDHESRIAYLEKICDEMNTDISNLKTIVTALETDDYVVNAYPLATNDGYTLVFKSGKSIVVHNGKDGKDGVDGTNGKDGVVPKISVKQDVDGFYYWTIDGEWLLIDGEKVRASAVDGKNGKDGENGVDGTNGVDGITPQFKIEENYWYISYDNGLSWELLGKATGSNGLDGINGADGDSMFKRVYVEDGYVCFEMNDEVSTIIRLPLMKDGILEVELKEAGTLSKVLTNEETRVTTSLVIKGRINEDDMKHVQIMNNLHTLDLSGAYYEVNWNNKSTDFAINPYRDVLVNRTLEVLSLPEKSEIFNIDLSYCISLRKVIVNSSRVTFVSSDKENGYASDMVFCDNINKLEFAEGLTDLDGCCGVYNWKTKSSINELVYPSTASTIPISITDLAEMTSEVNGRITNRTYTIPCNKLVCKALIPPAIKDMSNYEYDFENKCYIYSGKNSNGMNITIKHKMDISDDVILYVPSESIGLYRNAPLWDCFNIKAIEDME